MTQPPSISGVTEVGQTLTASTGEWLGTVPLTYSYQWLHCDSGGGSCTEISGATSATYVLASASVGFRLRVQVTASNTVGVVSALSDASAAVTALPVALTRAVNTSAPAISGVVEVGQTLTASSGAWTGSEPMSFDYQWLRCSALGVDCAAISGATAATYQVPSALVGATLKVRLVADNGAGAVEATSEPSTVVVATVSVLPSSTSLPTMSGLAEVGQTLVAGNGAWTGTAPIDYAYQWFRCDSSGAACAEIAGATSATLTLTDASLGATVRVRVAASNGAGTATAQSGASATVTLAPAIAVPQPPSIGTLPSVAGVLEVGQTLTAATGIWNGTPPLSYAYQWLHCDGSGGACVEIAGATDASYLLTSASLGSTLSVRVTATDSVGSASAVSPASGQVLAATAAAVPPANTALPAIGGLVEVGQTLTAADGLWTGTAPLRYAYQWQHCDASGAACVDVADATAATYELSSASVGSTVRVRVTATDAAGSASALSAVTALVVAPAELPVVPASVRPPTVAGVVQIGETLTVAVGEWTGTEPLSYAYQWLRCNATGGDCVEIAGATSASHALTAASLGFTLRVRETASNSVGSTVALSLPTIAVAAEPAAATLPVSVALPMISGEIGAGQTVTASSGEWTGTDPISFSHQWQLCDSAGAACSDIAGATTATHVLGAETAGSTLRVRVTAHNSVGSRSALSAATVLVAAPLPSASPPVNLASPTVAGVVEVGQTLTAAAGLWGGTAPLSYAYQWLRCDSTGGGCVEIAAATGSTYTLTSAALGATLSVRVTVTDSAGSTSALSVASAVVIAEPVVATLPGSLALPAITGELQVGETVTASTGEWTGTDPISFSYQWQRCDSGGGSCADIAGETSATLAIGVSALDSTLRVRVTATDAVGATSAVSAVSALVLAAPVAPVVPGSVSPPTVGGVVQVGQTLRAAAGIWTGSEPLSYVYQWLLCNATGGACAEIAGATSASYTLTSASLGATVRVREIATNSAGSTSELSAATVVVAAEPAAATRPANVGAPAISGELNVGETLSASSGAWTGSDPISFHYQWQQCDSSGGSCADIAGATSATHVLTTSSLGTTLRVRVTASDTAGSTSILSAVTERVEPSVPAASPAVNLSLPEISGEAQAGEPLTASSGVWTSTLTPTFAYQWLLCNASGDNCSDIPGATTAHYAVPDAAIGATLRVRVTASDSAGTTAALSAATTSIAPAPPSTEFPAVAGAPAVSGEAQIGQTLTASNGAWTGTPPLSYSYQWLRCDASGAHCSAIPGATAATFTLAVDLLAETVRVRVTATSDAGSAEATSAATPPITDPAHIEAAVASPASLPADGATVTAASSVTLTPAKPVQATVDLTLDGVPVSAVVTPTSVVIATGSLAPGLHDLEGALVYADGTQSPIDVHFTVAPAGTVTAPAAVAAAITPTAGRTVALPGGTSVTVPAGSIEDPGNQDRLILTVQRSLHTNPPPDVTLPTVLPRGLIFAGPVFTVTATWELARTRVVDFAKPLEVTIPAETTSTAVLPENAVLATASDGASGWRLLAACASGGRLAPGQADCFERSGKSFKVLTRHLSHFALLQRRAKLTVSLAVTRRVPLYSRRFVTTRITLSRPARATLSLRTRGGRVIRSRTAILPSGTSTVYLAGIPAHPFPRSGRYVLLLQITADGQTTSLRRTITLIRTRSPKRR